MLARGNLYITFVGVMLCFVITNTVWGMRPDDGDFYRSRYSFGGFGYGDSANDAKRLRLEPLLENIRGLQEELRALRKGGVNGPELAAKAQEHREAVEAYERETRVGMGDIIARGMVGDKWKYVADAKVDGVVDGIKLGAAMQVADAIGSVLKTKMRGLVNYTMGGMLDSLIGALIDGVNRVRSFLFHDSYEPFDQVKLDGFHTMVVASMNELERAIKEGAKESMRGQDMMPRKKSGMDVDAGKVDDAEPESFWMEALIPYMMQFEYYIMDIEQGKQYYKDRPYVIHTADQIILRLSQYNKLLSNSRSIKELDAKLDSNKCIIELVKKNLDNLFKQLSIHVKPRSYSVTEDTITSSSNKKSSPSSDRFNNGSDMDSPMPAPFWGS